MPRIKEMEDILKLLDEMPAERQLKCVKDMVQHVERWEERVAFDGSELEFLIEWTRRWHERRAAEGKGEPPF